MQEQTLRCTRIGLAGLMACLAVPGCSNGTSMSTPATPAVQVTVSGPAQVTIGASVQLTATLTNSSNTAVTWQVAGVAGGNSTVGTISSTGLYTPPAAFPATNPVTITAVSVASPSSSGSLSEVVSQTAAAAARFLDQTSFGPTAATIAQVQQSGLSAYLTQQFSTPTTLEPDIPVSATLPTYPMQCVTASYPCAESEWWQVALTGNDQLRQRVAFALSEICVTSTADFAGEVMTPYMNLLAKDAFTNYRTIMQDVTLSPAMGLYLNMVNSNKPAVVNGVAQIANENYSRELMQLFSLGLNQLNPDGTLQKDASGNPIPSFSEADVQGFARAYTGWTFSNADGSAPTKFPNNPTLATVTAYDYPMQPVAANHDILAKAILGGVTLPASQTAQQDLTASLDDLFNNSNMGPFVCKQLIQHLVSSNPSPAYVSRVAAVFANNGSNVRGDMQAVITAMLMDPDARAADTDPLKDGGHLREPILYITNLIRALGFTPTDPNAGADYAYMSLSNYASSLGERPLRSGSVFNFFPPSYAIPNTSLNAPEFGLENSATVILRLTLADNFVNNKISGFTTANLSATSPLGVLASATDPGPMVDSLAVTLMHSQLPANVRTAIVNHITTITGNPAMRVRVAAYLIISSGNYKIIS